LLQPPNKPSSSSLMQLFFGAQQGSQAGAQVLHPPQSPAHPPAATVSQHPPVQPSPPQQQSDAEAGALVQQAGAGQQTVTGTCSQMVRGTQTVTV